MALAKCDLAVSRKTLVVRVADMLASKDPHADLVTYCLGSCLGIAIYDPVTQTGGLLHVMLPDSNIAPAKRHSSPFMFVDSGVPRLFQAVYELGGERSRLEIKVAGGSQFMDQQGVFNIGERNRAALTRLLARHGLADPRGGRRRHVLADPAAGFGKRKCRHQIAGS